MLVLSQVCIWLAAGILAAGPSSPVRPAAPESLNEFPRWREPAEYHVQMRVKNEQQNIVIDRYISKGRTRMDMAAEGMAMSLIELADEKHTAYMLMPSEKMAMKQSWAAPKADTTTHPPASGRVTYMGRDTLRGRSVLKYRFDYEGGTAYSWNDVASGAPMRMESKEGTIDRSDPEAVAQKDELFRVPKDYQTMDMDALRGAMSGMGGPGMGVPGMGGPGAGVMSGMSGMAKGMLGNAGQQMAQNAGGSLGATIGAGFGGPLGAMVGHYVGSKAAGWLAGKATNAVMPGTQGMPRLEKRK
jgi:hypothetical protein